MTAIRDRQSDPDADDLFVPWDELPVVGTRRGLPWWGAVLLGFGLAALGAVASLQITDNLELIFQGAYFAGAVGAVAAVQRRSLFGPMVQPPLILAVTVPAALLFSGTPAGGDTFSTALAIATPLINGFPTMAITTGAALALGFFRIYRERDPDPPMKPVKKGDKDSRPAEAARPPAKARPRTDEDAPPRRPARARDAASRDAAGRDADRDLDRGRGPERSRDAERGRDPERGRRRDREPLRDRDRDREPPPRRPAAGSGGPVRRRPPEDTPRRREPLDREPRKRTPPPGDKPVRRTPPPPPRTGDAPRDRSGRPPGRRTPPPRTRPWDDNRD